MTARWLPLDKPAGFTSHDCVAVARRRLGLRRIGHTGTLDPDATGVLVLALDKATRLIQYLPGGKAYRAVIRLGIETDSYDAAGRIVQENPVPALSLTDLHTALAAFEGDQLQIPPMVSAISHQGKRLYELARQGIEVERPARAVHFDAIRLLNWQSPLLEIDVSCSAGTYIRSLAHDLGQQLGCGASLASLRRTRAHRFELQDCLQPEQLLPLAEQPAQGLPADWPLQHLPALQLPDADALQRLRQGQWLDFGAEAGQLPLVRLYTPEGEFAAMGESRAGLIKPCLLLIEPLHTKVEQPN